MEKVLNFVNNFLNKEYEAIVAMNVERDDEIYRAKIAIVRSFLAQDLVLKFSRPSDPEDMEEWFADGDEIVSDGNIQPRTLFQIKEYAHPTYKQLYRLYVSLPRKYRKGNPSYVVNFYIVPEGELFKIISQYDYDVCPDKKGIRMKDGGLTWMWMGGEQLKNFGTFVRSVKFQPPFQPEHLVEYEAQ